MRQIQSLSNELMAMVPNPPIETLGERSRRQDDYGVSPKVASSTLQEMGPQTGDDVRIRTAQNQARL